MRLRKLFPHYEGLGENWRARLLGAILSLSIPTTIVLTVIIFLSGTGFSIDLAFVLGGLFFEIAVLLVWARFGLNPAAVFLVFGSALITSVSIFYSDGISSAALVAQFFVVVQAALLTTTGVTLVVVLLTTIFNAFLVYSAEMQQFGEFVFMNGPFIRFSVQTAILLLSAGTILYSNRIIRVLIQNLTNSEQRFRALFEKTSDAVFITGLDLRLIEVNSQAAKMLDYKPEEMIGLPVQNLFPVDEWGEVQKRFETVKSTDFLAPTTRRFLAKTGDELMLETNLSLIQDAKGNPIHFQSTGRDVTQKVMEEQRMKSTLVHMVVKASTDSLTGILNRETVQQHARAEWDRYAREHQPMSLILIDLDKLKQINDTSGHNAGDQALNMVARVVDQHKRPYDWFGRYGGDEFLIVLPGTSMADAQVVAQRMESAINKEQVGAGHKKIELSCSFGVASTDGHEPPLRGITELIEMADVALYKVKNRRTKRSA